MTLDKLPRLLPIDLLNKLNSTNFFHNPLSGLLLNNIVIS